MHVEQIEDSLNIPRHLSFFSNVSRNEVLWTPLDCAASKGHARVIERLVNFKAGSDIDPKDKLNTTPLHLAAKEGHVNAVETLIKYGARVSDRDYRGFNALDWAIENGHRFVYNHYRANFNNCMLVIICFSLQADVLLK